MPQVAAQEAEAYRIIRRPDRTTAASIASSADSLFQVHDARPFSKVVPDVLADLKAEGIWRGDLKQQRRIMETFAWITGDKPLGQHMVTYIGATLPLPVNAAGKGPNIHSIRSLGSSFYEVDGVNEIMRADVMGHAREGTNAKHYPKRMVTAGLVIVLAERRDFIERYVPDITIYLEPSPIRLLPLEKRSRVGAGVARKRRSDAGALRTSEGTPPLN